MGGGQNKPDWSSKTTGGEMDTRSTTPDMAADKTKKHTERASEGKGEGTGPASGTSGETAGAMKDQVGKSG
ncbi:hypothetical protein [Sabulicella glaciei]|uniref:Uncharacterized protein n=1 Tax=Sabulicella glaciei TaxID=2984948 RepID=A0ABT3NV18_9PROT|nr:hypothetical protein [Roseococcus sp. MDT2-1-1]MCW8086000.1 hypothetical protein [Roseococcus sp. MDT2-1-1]